MFSNAEAVDDRSSLCLSVHLSSSDEVFLIDVADLSDSFRSVFLNYLFELFKAFSA